MNRYCYPTPLITWPNEWPPTTYHSAKGAILTATAKAHAAPCGVRGACQRLVSVIPQKDDTTTMASATPYFRDEYTGNSPMRRLRHQQGMTSRAFADKLGMTINQLNCLEIGSTLYVYEDHRAGIEAAGIDYDALRAEYTVWRDGLQGASGVHRLEPEHPIALVIANGVRGLHNIAHAAGVKPTAVRAFLRGEAI